MFPNEFQTQRGSTFNGQDRALLTWWHLNVGQHHVELLPFLEYLESRLSRRSRLYELHAEMCQHFFHDAKVDVVVVNDQHRKSRRNDDTRVEFGWR